jgi:hypothetical protein
MSEGARGYYLIQAGRERIQCDAKNEFRMFRLLSSQGPYLARLHAFPPYFCRHYACTGSIRRPPLRFDYQRNTRRPIRRSSALELYHAMAARGSPLAPNAARVWMRRRLAGLYSETLCSGHGGRPGRVSDRRRLAFEGPWAPCFGSLRSI